MQTELITITVENQNELALRFNITEDVDIMLPLGFTIMTRYGDDDDYDILGVFHELNN